MRLVFPLLSSPSGLTLSFLLDVYSSLSIGFSILALASLKYFPTHLLSVQIRPGHFFAWNPAMSSHSFKIKARLVKLCRLWLLLCFSALSHVPLSPAEMWTARETPPSFQFLKPWKLFSTLRPCLNTCLRALHTARLFLAFRSHLSGPLLRWVFLDYHKVHLTPHVTALLKHPHFFIALYMIWRCLLLFFLRFFFFLNMDHFLSLYWICYSISVLCFVFLTTKYVGS